MPKSQKRFPGLAGLSTWNDRPLQRYICPGAGQIFNIFRWILRTWALALVRVFLILAALTKDKERSATDQFAKLCDLNEIFSIRYYLVNWSWLQMPGRSNRWDIYIPPYLACKLKTILTAVYLRIKLLNIFRNRNAKKKIIESRPQVTNFTRS